VGGDDRDFAAFYQVYDSLVIILGLGEKFDAEPAASVSVHYGDFDGEQRFCSGISMHNSEM